MWTSTEQKMILVFFDAKTISSEDITNTVEEALATCNQGVAIQIGSASALLLCALDFPR